MAASVNPNSDPFRGGGRFDAGIPTSGPTGSIAPASDGGSLVGGVQGSTPMLARNNRGTNITIPYARVVMHPAGRTALPAAPEKQDPTQTTLGKPNSNVMIEVEQLYSGRLGFILGRRAVEYENSGLNNVLGMEARQSLSTQPINSRTQQMLYQFAVGGADQHTMQRMCSFEYLERYFYHVLRAKSINLSNPMYTNQDLVPAKYASGALAVVNKPFNNIDGQAVIVAIQAVEKGTRPIDALGNAVDLTPFINSGIFANDDGPFLRGKSVDTTVANYRRNHQSSSLGIADRLAFEAFERELKNAGALDWVPDGIVLSKLDSGGSDRLADDETDARDGQLYNVTIGGPAITSTWTGDPTMEVLPLDKLYIVLVGDVWNGFNKVDIDKVWEADTNLTKPYGKAFIDSILINDDRDATQAFQANGTRSATFNGTGNPAKQTITNIRVMKMTSSKMVSYSQYIPQRPDKSRLGLRIGRNGGEYILGGWCIGTILDSAAARAMPDSMNLVGSVKRARSAHANNVLVDIKWNSADDLYRKYMNRGSTGNAQHATSGTLRSRYDMRRRAIDPYNKPATKRL